VALDYDPTSSMTELEQMVYQALGLASMCWDPKPAGFFDSRRTADVGEELLGEIRRITGYQKDLTPESLETEEVERWLAR
jgi:hypothetical protein